MTEDLTGYHRIAAVGDVPPGEMRTFDVESESVALCNIDGKFFAMNNNYIPRDESPDGKALSILSGLSDENEYTPGIPGRRSATPAAPGIDTFETMVRGSDVFVKLDC